MFTMIFRTKVYCDAFSSSWCKHIVHALLPLPALPLLSRLYLYLSDICLCVTFFLFVQPGREVGQYEIFIKCVHPSLVHNKQHGCVCVCACASMWHNSLQVGRVLLNDALVISRLKYYTQILADTLYWHFSIVKWHLTRIPDCCKFCATIGNGNRQWINVWISEWVFLTFNKTKVTQD